MHELSSGEQLFYRSHMEVNLLQTVRTDFILLNHLSHAHQSFHQTLLLLLTEHPGRSHRLLLSLL